MLASQGGTCAICQQAMEKPCVDHCHVSGAVRGLLCQSCNKGLGFFRDNTKLLLSGVRYLQESDMGGFVRKITGATAEVNATNANTAAQEDATKQAAQDQQAALAASAQAASQGQAQLAARSAAEDKAQQSASTPLGAADVQLDADQTDSVTATSNKRKAQFGQNYSSGVQI